MAMQPQPQSQGPSPLMQGWLQDIRKQGHSDDEIMQALREGGHSDESIQQLFQASQPSQTPQGATFMGELHKHILDPFQQGMASLQTQVQQDAGHPLRGAWHGFTLGPRVLGGAVAGEALHTWDQLKQAAQSVQHPGATVGDRFQQVTDAAGHLMTAIPIFGGPVRELSEHLAKKEWGASTEDAGELALQVFGPEIFKGVLGGGAKATELGMNRLYQGAVKLPKTMSLAEIDATAKLGLDEGVNLTRGGLKKLGHVDNPETFLGQASDATKAIIAKHASEPVSWDTIEQGMKESIVRAGQASNAGEYVNNLLEEFDKFEDRYRWNHDPKTGVRTTEKPPLTVAQAQDIKKANYRLLSDSIFSDTASGVPAANKSALKELAGGLKQAIEERTPEVAHPNNQMHLGIQLQDAIADVLKSDPTHLKQYLRMLAFGAAGASAPHLMGPAAGHPLAAAGVATALTAGDALTNPQISAWLAHTSANAGQGVLSQGVANIPRLTRIQQIFAEGEQQRKQSQQR